MLHYPAFLSPQLAANRRDGATTSKSDSGYVAYFARGLSSARVPSFYPLGFRSTY